MPTTLNCCFNFFSFYPSRDRVHSEFKKKKKRNKRQDTLPKPVLQFSVRLWPLIPPCPQLRSRPVTSRRLPQAAFRGAAGDPAEPAAAAHLPGCARSPARRRAGGRDYRLLDSRENGKTLPASVFPEEKEAGMGAQRDGSSAAAFHRLARALRPHYTPPCVSRDTGSEPSPSPAKQTHLDRATPGSAAAQNSAPRGALCCYSRGAQLTDRPPRPRPSPPLRQWAPPPAVANARDGRAGTRLGEPRGGGGAEPPGHAPTRPAPAPPSRWSPAADKFAKFEEIKC